MAGANGAAEGRRRRLVPLWAILLLAAVAGCGSDEGERSSWPDGLTTFIDQSRLEFQGRTVYLRLIDEPEREVTVTRAEITSPRFGDVVWTGENSFQNETDLEFELPRGLCGRGVDTVVTLTYRLDDGPTRVSTTTAEDRYGSIGYALDRDCAERTLREAADIRLGEPRVTGRGADSVFVLPVTFTPTGARTDVTFRGFESTVLFTQVAGSASAETRTRIPLRGQAVTVQLRLVPARCDPHALAEDKVGTLIPVRVQAPELGHAESFHLPLGDRRRGALRGFFGPHCGL